MRMRPIVTCGLSPH